jgi:hypothetical protein
MRKFIADTDIWVIAGGAAAGASLPPYTMESFFLIPLSVVVVTLVAWKVRDLCRKSLHKQWMEELKNGSNKY